MSAIRARFYVAEVSRHAGSPEGRAVTLRPVVRPTNDNIEWSKYTPSGEFKMNVTTEGAATFFDTRLGKDVSILIEDIDETPSRDPEVPNSQSIATHGEDIHPSKR